MNIYVRTKLVLIQGKSVNVKRLKGKHFNHRQKKHMHIPISQRKITLFPNKIYAIQKLIYFKQRYTPEKIYSRHKFTSPRTKIQLLCN